MTDSAESLSFFDTLWITAPEGLERIESVEVTPTLDVSYLNQNNIETPVGNIVHDDVKSLENIELVEGTLIITRSNSAPLIELEGLVEAYTYVSDVSGSSGLYNETTKTFNVVGSSDSAVVTEQTDSMEASLIDFTPPDNTEKFYWARYDIEVNESNYPAVFSDMTVNVWVIIPFNHIDTFETDGDVLITPEQNLRLKKGFYRCKISTTVYNSCAKVRLRAIDTDLILARCGSTAFYSSQGLGSIEGDGVFYIEADTDVVLERKSRTAQGSCPTVWSTVAHESSSLNIELIKMENVPFEIARRFVERSIIPSMQSNDEQNVVISSNRGLYVNNALYEPYKACDYRHRSDSGVDWHTWIGQPPASYDNPSWLQIQFTDGPKRINGYSWRSSGHSSNSYDIPKTWVLQGSDDGVNWIPLHEVVEEESPTINSRLFKYDNIGEFTYSYYRLYIVESFSSSFDIISQFRLYQYPELV